MSRGEKALSESLGASLEPVLRQVKLTDVIELFRDPETETVSEGHARVWEVLEEDDRFYTLLVSYMKDPAGPDRKFVRKYRKWKNQ